MRILFTRLSLVLTTLLLAGCTVNPSGPLNLPTQPAPPAPKSRIGVSLKTSWPALVDRVDGAIPRCDGTYVGDDNSTCLGTEQSGNFIVQREAAKEYISPGDTIWFKGSVWRWDRVTMSLADGNFHSGLKSLYHLEVGWDPFGPIGTCGHRPQPARFLFVGFDGRINLNPGWYVDPILSAYARHDDPNRRCDLTVFNIHASGLIERVTSRVLESAKNKAVDRIRERTNFKNKAAAIWTQINQPINVTNNVWLSLRPEAAFAGPLTVNGQYLTLPAALDAKPILTIGPKPAPGQKPLPDLIQAPLDPKFNLNLRATVSFAEISQRLRNAFANELFTLGTRWPLSQMTFKVTDVQVRGSGAQIVIAISIDGFAKGTMYLFGTPVFHPGSNDLQGSVSIEGVDYSLETRNILADAGDIIFHNRLQERIQNIAHWDVSRQLQKIYSSIQTTINRQLSPDAELKGEITQFGPGQIWVSSSGVEAFYPIGGQLTVIASPL